jgi:Ras association domain-containing protein 9/10
MSAAPAAEIPIWVNGFQRWISGIGRKTTCDDVIRVLLRAEGSHMNDERHARHYAIVERWRKVERPLDGRSRILKVWSTWGDEQAAVRLTLRRVNPTTPRDVKTYHQRRSKHSATTPPHYRARLLQTVHPKRLLQQGAGELDHAAGFTDVMEKLMKLILAQGETIQSQLRRLHERDEQIHRIEHKVHRKRVEKLGSNYLLETYLGSLDKGEPLEEQEERGEDSGVAEVGSGNGSAEVGTSPTEDAEETTRRTRLRSRTRRSSAAVPAAAGISAEADDEDDGAYCAAGESSSSSDDAETQSALVELRACIALWERIIRVNKCLEKQEQCLVKLHVKLRRYSNSDPPTAEVESATEEATTVLREQLEEAIALSDVQEQKLEANNLTLKEMGSQLEDRNRVLDCLRDQLNATEAEEAHLHSLLMLGRTQQQAPPVMTRLHHDASNAITRCGPVLNKLVDSDSNSDTGLSSLHSSGEEGGYVLDTLV